MVPLPLPVPVSLSLPLSLLVPPLSLLLFSPTLLVPQFSLLLFYQPLLVPPPCLFAVGTASVGIGASAFPFAFDAAVFSFPFGVAAFGFAFAFATFLIARLTVPASFLDTTNSASRFANSSFSYGVSCTSSVGDASPSAG